MAWPDDLTTRLRSAATTAGNRVAWYERQRGWGDKLAVLLNLEDEGRDYTHDGPSGLDQPEVMVDVFGASGSAVEALAGAVRTIFETPGQAVGATRFGMGFVRAGRTLGPEDMPDGARVFRRRMLVRFSVETA
ncbi:hypothetical protein V6U71_21490 [Sphingopyxis sp. J-6]|uniref:hypothetical protein n=1 Tax=Sphingopyxis sp. J-6 TaxID=3122054 RepID=UPI0039841C17